MHCSHNIGLLNNIDIASIVLYNRHFCALVRLEALTCCLYWRTYVYRYNIYLEIVSIVVSPVITFVLEDHTCTYIL